LIRYSSKVRALRNCCWHIVVKLGSDETCNPDKEMITPVKYQIFVSSTYEDLKSHRDQVVRGILEMGHIPVGMEMFSAADETQWQLIQRQIEASDYYVVLIAYRYGSMDGATGFTEKEYDYAVSLGIPALGFILQDDAAWPQNLVDKEPAKVVALSAFKDKVRKRLVSHWSSADELHGKVSIALMKQFIATPRDGWVKASSVASPQIASELARLSQENGEIRETLRKAQLKETVDQESAISKSIRTLKANTKTIRIFYKGDNDWTTEGTRTLFDLFFLIAPELMVEKSIEDTSRYVASMWKADRRTLRQSWPIPSNAVKTWFADLAALGLMEPSRKRLVTDKTEYWTLTEAGRNVYMTIRKARLEAGLPTQADAVGEDSGHS
jgi:hypothetical protein